MGEAIVESLRAQYSAISSRDWDSGRPDDVEACAQIVYEAFGAIHGHHNLPRDFPVAEVALAMMSLWVLHPQAVLGA